MDNDLDTTDDGNQPQQSTGNGLRSKLEAEQAENKALKERLAALEKRDRQRAVSDALKEAKAPDALARFVISDLGDAEVTGDAVKKWLEDNGSLFGYKPGTEQPAGGDAGSEAPEAPQQLDPVEVARRNQARRMAAMVGAAPETGGNTLPTVEWLSTATDDELAAAGWLIKNP